MIWYKFDRIEAIRVIAGFFLTAFHSFPPFLLSSLSHCIIGDCHASLGNPGQISYCSLSKLAMRPSGTASMHN